jgi:hypothetical protein
MVVCHTAYTQLWWSVTLLTLSYGGLSHCLYSESASNQFDVYKRIIQHVHFLEVIYMEEEEEEEEEKKN